MMQELSVTAIWMAGVVGMMVVFGVIALIGIFRNSGANGRDKDD